MAGAHASGNGVMEWWSAAGKSEIPQESRQAGILRPVAIQPFGPYHTVASLAHKPRLSRKKRNFVAIIAMSLALATCVTCRPIVPRPDARRAPPRPKRAGAMSPPGAREIVAALGRAPHYGLEHGTEGREGNEDGRGKRLKAEG